MSKVNSIVPPISLTTEIKDDPLDEKVPYREDIGSIVYAAVTTRPDIAHAVNCAARRVENLTISDWIALKRIIRYLKDRENYGITYKRNEETQIIGYCDADFAGDGDTSRSTTGIVIMLANGPFCVEKSKTTINYAIINRS